MADPILTETGDRVRHAERDAIAVEAHDAPHPVGINAETDFVRRIHPPQTAEHDPYGVHDTPKIARAKLIFEWVNGGYRLSPRSYLLGEYGSGIATATPLGGGQVQIELAASLGTTDFAIADCSIEEHPLPYNPTVIEPDLIVTMLSLVSSDARFTVVRYVGPLPADLQAADGDFTILIFAG